MPGVLGSGSSDLPVFAQAPAAGGEQISDGIAALLSGACWTHLSGRARVVIAVGLSDRAFSDDRPCGGVFDAHGPAASQPAFQ